MNKLFWIGILLLPSFITEGQNLNTQSKRNSQNQIRREVIDKRIQFYIQYYKENSDSVEASLPIVKELLEQSVSIKYSKGIILTAFYAGDCYLFLNDPPNAIKHFLISLKESEKIKSMKDVSLANMGIGLVYLDQKLYDKAIESFMKASEYSKRIKELSSYSTQLYLIGYSQISLNRYDEAKIFLDSALMLKTKLKDVKGKYECQLSIANYFLGKNQYDSALLYYNMILGYFEDQKEFVPVSYIQSSLAEISFRDKHYNEALKHAKEALFYADKVGVRTPKLKASHILYRIYEKLGIMDQAFLYLHQYNYLKDSLENKEFTSQISIAQATYNFEKEEAIMKSNKEKSELRYRSNLKYEKRKQQVLILVTGLSILLFVVVIIANKSIIKQRQISEDLLLNILPEQTAKELKNLGSSVSRQHEKVSIMFCDIKNFSHLAETLSPQNVVEMLDHYFKNFDDIIDEYSLEKIKTIGDAYMCAGGLHPNLSYQEKNIVLAAIKILEFIKSAEAEMNEKYGSSFTFRVGIHIGNVVSGVVGKRKFTYDIWGDAVNVAARMEQNSMPGKINVSGETFLELKEDFEFEYRGKIQAKNKGEIDMYFVKV
ncbi:MAG: hypothetical protein H6605_05545 [Flavobacteriales bacterium]|nr:hypothetical protein [Flavobacteriales bacterium]